MKYNELPLHVPLVKIDSFDGWQQEYSKDGQLMPNYRGIYDRLIIIQNKLSSDPIEYIIKLSKENNLKDFEVANKLNTLIDQSEEWTPKMVFTLRKQCGILGNDYRGNALEVAQTYSQPTPVQDTVNEYLLRISLIIPDLGIAQIVNQEDRLMRLVASLGFESIDKFMSELISKNLGERPIKNILDALYIKHSISEGKGNRVGYVYIRNKIKFLKVIL